eukprot:gene37676-46479_t
MKIGVIGAGNIGGEVIRNCRKAGHSVLITNSRGGNSLDEIVAETGAVAVSLEELVKNSEIIILSIPFGSVASLPKELFANLPSHVVIGDTGNYSPSRDVPIPELDNGSLTDAEWVSNQLGRSVCKIFNSITKVSLNQGGLPVGHKDRIAIPVAGESLEHKNILFRLLDSIGFDGVDGGVLSESWRQQSGAGILGDINREEMIAALA